MPRQSQHSGNMSMAAMYHHGKHLIESGEKLSFLHVILAIYIHVAKTPCLATNAQCSCPHELSDTAMP